MARTVLTVQEIVISGLENALEAANADGEEFANDGNVFIMAANGSGGAITLTFKTPGTVGGGVAIDEHEVSIAAGDEEMIGPFDPAIFNQSDGNVDLDFSAVTSLTVGAFKLPNP